MKNDNSGSQHQDILQCANPPNTSGGKESTTPVHCTAQTFVVSMHEMRPNRVLVVWDFDFSLINENSDTYVIRQLDPTGGLWAKAENKLHNGTQWTKLMDWAVGELHNQGHDATSLSRVLATIPVMRGAREAVRHASDSCAEQRILSDANTYYIDECLREPLSMRNVFSTVYTNPGQVDEQGRLHISPADTVECRNCPVNLCKGRVLESWMSEQPYNKIIYVGDGGGDFCPALKLRVGDVLLARRAPRDTLLKKVRNADIKAEVIEWGGKRDIHGVDLFVAFVRHVPFYTNNGD